VKHLGHFLQEHCGLSDVAGVALTVVILCWVVWAIDAAAAHSSLLSLFR